MGNNFSFYNAFKISLFTFMYLPFGEMVTYSFYKMKYIGERTFVGVNNYKDLFTRDSIFNSLKLSLYYMGGLLFSLFQLYFWQHFVESLAYWLKTQELNNVSLVGTSVRRYLGQDQVANTSQKVELASAMAVYLLLIIFVVTIIQKLVLKYAFRNADTGSGKGNILCSCFKIYWNVILPLLKPATVTSLILKGVSCYNEYY